MDLTGTLTQTEGGQCYIVALADDFLEFPVAVPLKLKPVTEVEQLLLDTMCDF